MKGVIAGGWEYVVAAYAVTAIVLLGYGMSVFARLRALAAKAAREAGKETHG